MYVAYICHMLLICQYFRCDSRELPENSLRYLRKTSKKKYICSNLSGRSVILTKTPWDFLLDHPGNSSCYNYLNTFWRFFQEFFKDYYKISLLRDFFGKSIRNPSDIFPKILQWFFRESSRDLFENPSEILLQTCLGLFKSIVNRYEILPEIPVEYFQKSCWKTSTYLSGFYLEIFLNGNTSDYF